MLQPLSHANIDGKYSKKLFVQDYNKKPSIEGIKIVELKNSTGEDGDFSELIRLNEQGEAAEFPGFFLRQVNRSKMLPGTIKAWHIHYNQEDIWHIPPSDQLLLGLLDVRKDSPTKHLTMRLALGNGKAHLVYIPRGVAHGASNLSKKATTVVYFVNQQFDINDPDERRLPWDIIGSNFWEMTKG